MTPTPPSDKPPIPPGSGGPGPDPGSGVPTGKPPTGRQPANPTGKKLPQGWQLPLDGPLQAKARLHPVQRKRLEAKPPSRFWWYVAFLAAVLLIMLVGSLVYWREPIRKAIHQWSKDPIQEPITSPGTSPGKTSPFDVSTASRSITLPPPSQTIAGSESSTPGFPTVIASPPKNLPATASRMVSTIPPGTGTGSASTSVTASVVASVAVLVLPPPTRLPKPPEVVLPTGVFEEEAHRQTQAEYNLVFGGKPRPTLSDAVSEVLYNQGYVVGYSESRQDAIWVGYRLDTIPDGGSLPRPKKFVPDDRTQAHVNSKEYTNSGYDRGHLAPNSAIARRFGADAQLETFLLSNITPQRPDFNRKVWQRLERLEEKLANEYDGLYVITGPIFDEYKETLSPRSDVEIPDEFFKILVDEKEGNMKMLAFRIPQTVAGKEPLEQFLTSVDDIQSATGLDFFWALSDPLEIRLESTKPSEVWGAH